MGINVLNWIVRNILVNKLSRFGVIFIFFTPAAAVSEGRHIMQCHINMVPRVGL